MAVLTFFIGLILGVSVGFGMAALFGANDYGDYELPDLPNDEQDKKR